MTQTLPIRIEKNGASRDERPAYANDTAWQAWTGSELATGSSPCPESFRDRTGLASGLAATEREAKEFNEAGFRATLAPFFGDQNRGHARSSDVTSLKIEELPDIIREDVEDYLETHPQTPAARLRPKIGMAGDLWLAFIGSPLREGAAGLGNTPRDALEDFNRHFLEPIVSRNGSSPH